jgi:hypothetical protein
MIYLTDKQCDEVLSKLFEAVGKKFHSIGRSCRGQWFSRSTWTLKQEKNFEEWLTTYTAKHLHIPKNLAKKKAQMFCFCYGWKYEPKYHREAKS